MGVYIRDMEMPKDCGECQFFHTENFTIYCCPTGREDIFYDAMPEWCPLEEPKTEVADRPQETSLKEAEVLLKATRNLLNKQNESIYVLNMLAETVTYHGAECDGSCLIDDIDAWFSLYGSEEGADDEEST